MSLTQYLIVRQAASSKPSSVRNAQPHGHVTGDNQDVKLRVALEADVSTDDKLQLWTADRMTVHGKAALLEFDPSRRRTLSRHS